MDFKIGRMNTIIGYNGFLAPYRPFYSSDYQFFYSQDGAFTGWLTDLHVTNRLDVWNGMTLGANTFFVQRSSRSICYIGQVNYWLTDEKRTRLTASVYTGPNAIFAAPNLAGDFVTMVELRLQQNWSQRFTQIIQNNMGWDAQHSGRHRVSGTGFTRSASFIIDAQFDTQLSRRVVRRRQRDPNWSRHQLCRGDRRAQLASRSSALRSARRSAATSPVHPPSGSTARTPIAASCRWDQLPGQVLMHRRASRHGKSALTTTSQK